MLAKYSSYAVFDPALHLDRLAGTHRIQRVPPTEKRGRRHSSLVTVVVLDDSENNEAPRLDHSELRIETYRDSGPGGQHRNVTDSAVRMTHLPTGVVVTAVEDRSQHKNRKVAMQRMQDALRERHQQNMSQQRNDDRIEQFSGNYAFTWTDWRDEVKAANGNKVSMKRALKGDLKKLAMGACVL